MVYRALLTLLHAVFRLLFTLEYTGEEHVPDDGPAIIAANHPSYLDPVLLCLPLDRRVRFMAWDKLFTVPVVGSLMRQFGAFPVRLGTRDPNAFQAALAVLQEGTVLGIFPEAGRSVEGTMNPLKTGVARLAIESGAPIVPTTITGAYDAWPSSRRLPWPRKITVKYHAPIVLDEGERVARREDKAYHDDVTTVVREKIERRLRPSLAADVRKRRAFEGPASPIRVYELDPAIAAIAGIAFGGPVLPFLALAAAHALYLVADILWFRQGRLAKAARELVTPAVTFAMAPFLARTVGLEVLEWASLLALAAGAGLAFNWANRYKAERFIRGMLFAFLWSFVIALFAPHPYGPHVAVSAFIAVYAVGWRPLHWPVLALVASGFAAVQLWAAAAPLTSGLWYLLLAAASAAYVRVVKFSAHDGRVV